MDKNEFGTKKVLLSLLSIVILILSQILANLAGSIFYVTSLPDWLGNIIYGIIYVLLAYYLVKLLCVKLLGISPDQCRIEPVKIKLIWAASAVALPALVTVVLLALPGKWIDNQADISQILNNTTAALFYIGMGAGVVEEIVFRGVIMTALEKRWNKVIAILIPSMAFGLLHALGGNMSIVSILLLFVAGTAVGVLFSLVTYESGSIWNAAILHGFWNCIMIGGILDIGVIHDETSVFSYLLQSDSLMITGGDFGIEASVISVAGYILFASMAFLLWKKAGSRVSEKSM